MAGRGRDLTLTPCVHDLCRLFGLPGDKRRVHFRDARLLCTEAPADAGLDHTHLRDRNPEGIGDVPPCMEHDLGGRHNEEPSVHVNDAPGAEGLHECLLHRLRVAGLFYDNVTGRKLCLDISVFRFLVGTEIPLCVSVCKVSSLPVVLRVNDDFVVESLGIVKDGLQLPVRYFNQLHCPVDALFVLPRNDRRDISHVSHVLIEDQAVIRACLGVGLTCLGKAAHVLVHIVPGKDGLHAGDLHGCRRVNVLDDGIRIRAAKELYHQAVFRLEILRVQGSPRDNRLPVLLPV